jgi:P-type Cu+ transporter
VLFPFTDLLLSPLIAALVMSFSSVSVVGNALRLRAVPLSAIVMRAVLPAAAHVKR